MTKKILIDAGHGGVFAGWYCTAGKRSPEVPPGFYEGEFNRMVAGLLAARLKNMGVDAVHINPGPVDIPESAKVAYGRAVAKQFGASNVIWLSLHCNASPRPGWDDTTNGATVFVKRNDAKSESLARHILTAWASGAGVGAERGVQKKGFNILFGTPISALLEMGFMTSRHDVEMLKLQYHEGIAKVADVLARMAKEG